jgi:phospho-N-acetylmuramoyl-pentapeptide-transferase
MNVSTSLNFWLTTAMFLSFGIAAVLGKFAVSFLKKLKYGQTILEIGPKWHGIKQGTPTMGGIVFIASIVISCAVCIPLYFTFGGFRAVENKVMNIKLFAGILMALAFAIIGFTDDFAKVKMNRNKGINPKQKLVFQFFSAAIYLGIVYMAEHFYSGQMNTFVGIPFFGKVDFGLFYWPFAAIIIVGIVNAANLNDGIDGLCSCVTAVLGVGMIFIAKMLMMFGLAIESAALVGGCLGFLVWNYYPAQIFMGDTGSMFLGGMVCALGMATENISALIMLSMVYILEMFSVIAQVIYFKISHGKRLFKMTPIHHHFEMLGFSEKKICKIVSCVEVIFAIATVAMLYFDAI